VCDRFRWRGRFHGNGRRYWRGSSRRWCDSFRLWCRSGCRSHWLLDRGRWSNGHSIRNRSCRRCRRRSRDRGWRRSSCRRHSRGRGRLSRRWCGIRSRARGLGAAAGQGEKRS
jgi:hypothetical protein